MIKTVWIPAYFHKKGQWEEYDENTGKTETNPLGAVIPITVRKKRWVILDEYRADLIDGERLSKDTEKVLNQLDSEGFDVQIITPVISGQYDWTPFSSTSISNAPSTCASWGYGVTSGVMVTARKK